MIHSEAGADPEQPHGLRTGESTIRYLVLLALVSCSIAHADGFVGQWQVVDVVENSEFPWHEEIKYPRSFVIEEKNGVLKGRYTDQYGYECDFETVSLINNGNELLLSGCLSTKHATSWAPIYKVKNVDGKLRGLVVTSDKKFEWLAERSP